MVSPFNPFDIPSPKSYYDSFSSSPRSIDISHRSFTSKKSVKLDTMKNDLIRAADTIAKIRKERDNLKENLHSEISQKEEIILRYREKGELLDSERNRRKEIERLLEDVKGRNIAMQEDLGKFKKEVTEKNKIIQFLDSKMKEMKETYKHQ